MAVARAGALLSGGAPFLVLLDLDGTLAHFRVDPERVKLGADWKALLALLVRRGAKVAILTGRRALQAAAIVGVRGVEVVGLHGAERFRAGRLQRVPVRPATRRELGHLLEEARALAAELPGSRVEDKRPGGVVLHTRGARPGRARAANRIFARRILGARGQGIELLRGKRMIEARAAGTDKGTAARLLFAEASKEGSAPLALFAGDDRTDEDAFRVLRRVPHALTLRVGGTPGRTAARFRVRSSRDLYRILVRLTCYLPRARGSG